MRQNKFDNTIYNLTLPFMMKGGIRMPKNNIVASLDVGTSKVAAFIGEVHEDGHVEITGTGITPSKGLRKGVVVNLETTTNSIKKAMETAKMMAGVEVNSVFAGVAGGHIRGINHHAIVLISNKKNRIITEADVKRVIDQAKNIEMPIEREILAAIPREFIVDDNKGIIVPPIGMTGTRLEALVHIVTGAVTSIQNIIKAINNAGLSVEDIVLQPIASGLAVLDDDEKRMGVILVDIGAGTTDVVAYVNGTVWHTGVIPVGGDQLTNDIAVGLRTPMISAETIKKDHGCAMANMVDGKAVLDIPGIGGRQSQSVSERVLAKIIEPRAEEIMDFVYREIQGSGYGDMIKSGVVLTGGTSMLNGITNLAERVFGVPVRVGYPQGVNGLIEKVKEPMYATGVGLLLHGAEERKKNKGVVRDIKPNHFNKIYKRMKDWLSDYF